MDHVRLACPSDRPFHEPAREILSHMADQGFDARIVAIKQCGGPERLRIAPVRPVLLPTGGEIGNSRAFPGGINGGAVLLGLGQQLFCVLRPAQAARGIGGQEQAAQVPEIVAHDVVFAVRQKFTVGKSGGQKAGEGRVRRRFAALAHRPGHGVQHARVGAVEKRAITGDAGVLPQRPQRLAVAVQFVRLRLEQSIRALPREKELDRPRRHLVEAGLL